MTEIPAEQEKLTINALPTLNVLTILTIIGSVVVFITSIYNYFTVCASANTIEKLLDVYPDDGIGAVIGQIVEATSDGIQAQCDNRLLMTCIGFLASALCLAGALYMRKLKKMGLGIYLAGEFLLPLFTIFFIGGGGLYMMLMSLNLIVPIIFAILYLVQRKHLVH